MVRDNLLAASLHSLGMSDGCSIMEVLCSTEETQHASTAPPDEGSCQVGLQS